MAQDKQNEYINSIEIKKCDTKIRFEKNGNDSPVKAELEISPDSPICHANAKIHKPGHTMTLIDHALRFSETGSSHTRLSELKVWFDGQQVVPPSFPTNQIYGFKLNGQYPHYGMFDTFNQTLKNGSWMDKENRPWIDGTNFSLNQANDALMTTLATIRLGDDAANPFLFSAVMVRKSGEWYIFPENFDGYASLEFSNTTVQEKDASGFPKTICYEYEEEKHPRIKLILESSPDLESNHKIEKKQANGREIVLIDGEARMYDPASPLRSKISGAKIWWDGKEVVLRNFPGNHFFNFSLWGMQDSNYGAWRRKSKGDPSADGFYKAITEDRNSKMPSDGFIRLGQVITKKYDKEANGIGIYPSTDRNALYVGFVRKDPVSGILAYCALIIDRNGNCDVFPKNFDEFCADKGQYVKVLEGYSDHAPKKPAPFVPKKHPEYDPNAE